MILKNKKIACFVALPHHTRFLWPIAEMLEKQGAKITFFTTMSDYPFERDLMKRGKECKLLQSYGNEKTRDKIAETTREFLDLWVPRIFEWDGMRHWAFVLQSTILVDGFTEYFCLEEFIGAEKPDLFLALHERNRWGKLIGHLAGKHGIPYVTLQEGDYYEDRLSFSGHTEYSTALLLWGRGIEERLSRMKSTPEKFVRTGNTHLATVRTTHFRDDSMQKTRKELNIPGGKKVVLFLVGIQWGVIKDAPIWDELLSGIGDDVVKIFKWHPKVTYGSFKKNVEEMFKEKFPSCIVLHTHDPYSLIPISDYCITLGKTTLAVEALSFGKPLFSLPGRDGEIDHYAQWGISQQLWPPGNYDPLYKTMESGVPEKIQQNAEMFLNEYFYKNNAVSVERAVEAIDYILECRRPVKAKGKTSKIGKEYAAGQVSFIVPSGDDPDALVATITTLSQNVKFANWEVIITVNNTDMKEMLSGISGDVRIIESSGDNLPALYNKGAGEATGETLIFLKPGIVYFKDKGLLDAAKDGIAGVPIKNNDMTPYCLGIAFDFNHVPYMIREEIRNQQTKGTVPDLRTEQSGVVESGLSPAQSTPPAVGGGLLCMHREVFENIGGFDEGIANHLMEADICLSARNKGYAVTFLPECLGIVYKETFIHGARGEGQEARGTDSDEEWKGRIRFFAKWCGKLPKGDDYLKFAGDLLKV